MATKRIGLIISLVAVLFLSSSLWGRGIFKVELGASGAGVIPVKLNKKGIELDEKQFMEELKHFSFGLDANFAVSIFQANVQPLFLQNKAVNYAVIPVNAMLRADLFDFYVAFGGGVSFYKAHQRKGLLKETISMIEELRKKRKLDAMGYQLKAEVGIPLGDYVMAKPFVYLLTNPAAEHLLDRPLVIGGLTISGVVL